MSAMAMAQNSEASLLFKLSSLNALMACMLLALQTTSIAYAQNLPGQNDLIDPANNPLTKVGVTTLPGVRSSITYSDNISQLRKGSEIGGFRLEVSPYILAAANTSVAQGYVYYALRNFYRTAGADGAQFDAARHDLRSNGKLQLIDDFLYIRGSAFNFNVNPINFSQTSFDPAAVSTFNYRVQGFNLSPYIESRRGNFANYSAAYYYGQSGIVGATGQNQVSSDVRYTGSASSGSAFNQWGWSWTGENQERSFNNRSYGRNASTGIIYWVPTDTFRIGASMRYSQIDGFINQKGKDAGYGPGLALDWAPSTRTKLKITSSAEYFGNTGDATFTHDAGRLSIVAAYERSVLSSNDATLLNQNPTFFTSNVSSNGPLSVPFRNFVADSLYARYGVLTGLGVVDSAYVLRSGGRVSLSYKLSPLSTASLSLFDYTSSTRTTTSNPGLGGISVLGSSLAQSGTFFGTLHTTYASFNVSLGLDATSKLSFTYDDIDNRYVTILRRNKISSFSTTYSTKISPSSTASIGLRHVAQSSTGYQASAYNENSVFSSLDMRF
jgi:uncharacterized protein (PEP-CTERM system associated)